jgi:hypothetical protein
MAEQTKEPEKYTHRFELKKCPVVEVKIYNDRAEVDLNFKVLICRLNEKSKLYSKRENSFLG